MHLMASGLAVLFILLEVLVNVLVDVLRIHLYLPEIRQSRAPLCLWCTLAQR